MAVNRIGMHAVQRPDESWQLVISGWRVDNTVAWTKSVSLSVREAAGIDEVLLAAGVTIQNLLS